jgi:hypothetical protein
MLHCGIKKMDSAIRVLTNYNPSQVFFLKAFLSQFPMGYCINVLGTEPRVSSFLGKGSIS